MKEHIGIYPGTFDPITIGHVDIIKRALGVVDKLIVGIAEDNPKTPVFSISQRIKFIKNTFADENIEVVTFKGLLVDFAGKNNVGVIIRGLRAVSDFEYEFQMSCMNSKLRPEIQTIFLPASEKTHFISSRFVREIASLGGDVSGLVPGEVAKKLKEHYAKK